MGLGIELHDAMITSIEGLLAGAGLDWVDIAVGGVTLRVNIPQSAASTLGGKGDRVRLFTALQFRTREDSLTLYGFPTAEARSAFEALIAVIGVGPRVALSILSGLSPESLALAVARGDADALKGIHGVGTRTANRIVLELKGKLDIELAATPASSVDGEVVAALTALGYGVSEAMEAVSSLPPGDSTSLEEKVRLCLKRMGSR